MNKLSCKHDYKFVKNFYGDAINFVSPFSMTIRSQFICIKCKHIKYSKYLYYGFDGMGSNK